MKKFTLFLIILFLSLTSFSQWTQKANFGGSFRVDAVGFSLSNKGYIGTGSGFIGGSYPQEITYKDFWEYDTTSNSWTQKADFGGTARIQAVAFSIGSKGYIGTGGSTGYTKDFWEYDPISNLWTQKTDFPGAARWAAVGFSIGNKGYIGTGADGVNSYKDFWEYDPVTNTWTQKADFPGTVRSGAIGFSIGSKGYIGLGFSNGYNENDFWEYDPVTNTWTQKADFPTTGRQCAIGFAIGLKGYVGTGFDGSNKNDIWEWDQATNTWSQKYNFGGTARREAVAFSINNKGYVGTGTDGSDTYDFWEYNPENDLTFILQNVNDNFFSIFPNPTIDKIEIVSKPYLFIEIINSQGQVIKKIHTESTKTIIDFSKYSSGIYIIKTIEDKGIVMKKFIKQ